jgi:parallel beta-helix repeat protein
MQSNAIRRGLMAAAVAAVGAAIPSAAGAATINVHPGPNAIQKGINKADRGDTLRIHGGRYPETPRVTEHMTLKGVDGRPVIDAKCDDDTTVDVISNGVTLRHLKVQGAAETGNPGYTVNFIGIDTGTVEDVDVKESCGGHDAAQYGINLTNTGKIQVLDNRTHGGFQDAGIYVGSIGDTLGGALRVKANVSYGNERGIIIEDSFDEAVDMRVIDNTTHDNTLEGLGFPPTGIFVRNSDHGIYEGNVTDDNGDYGIHIDAQSDDNVFTDNSSHGNGISDLFNEGTGNCNGGGNDFGTTSGTALGPC